jgi:hypothetical protein
LNCSRSVRRFSRSFRIEARFLEFMIGDGALHSLGHEINPLLNLGELFGGSHFLALFVFFRLIACVNGEVGWSVRDTLLLDGPDATARFTLSKPLVQTGEGGSPALRNRGFRLLHLLPYRVQW